MLATQTSRSHPFSVHLKRAEVVELLEEFSDAVPYCAEELPHLAAIRTKLSFLLSDRKNYRA
ncbi:hypothetical protein HXS80_15925 [Streptomyces sp. CB04723]|uniref:hypothetical protein n=1 Tax=Streptomyces TaxID=1883 RepID=UPI0015C4C075|nr:hypothetical protein [Streptomyces sp. CB04723]QLG33017.1 hypothetical protein HXS80_15925 [Streptomyces sp. CB04723]